MLGGQLYVIKTAGAKKKVKVCSPNNVYFTCVCTCAYLCCLISVVSIICMCVCVCVCVCVFVCVLLCVCVYRVYIEQLWSICTHSAAQRFQTPISFCCSAFHHLTYPPSLSVCVCVCIECI